MTNEIATVTLQKQERTGNYLFNGNVVMTSNFERTFDGNVFYVVLETLAKIRELVLTNSADYFQVAVFTRSNGSPVKYWVIDDVSVVTFLMPEDY